MELIPRYELQLECRDAGYNIIQESLKHGPDISTERLDELFEPLITSIETRTRDAVEKEIDEYRGQKEDRDESEECADLVDERRSAICEKYVYHITNLEDDDEFMMNSNYSWYTPRINTDHIKFRKIPGQDLSDVQDNDFLEIDPDDEFWDDYHTNVYITCSTAHLANIYRLRIQNSTQQLLSYVSKNGKDSWNVIVSDITMLKECGVFVPNEYDIICQLHAILPNFCRSVLKSGKRKGNICGRIGKCRHLTGFR
jgi:hypothetical protein